MPVREEHIRQILAGIDGELNEEVLANTPRRVTKMYNEELLCGYKIDPAEVLSTIFPSDHQEMILVTNIEFSSLCEHHLLPFRGVAHVGYLPNGGIVGLSKIARLVNCFSARLQLQERLASQIADALMNHIDPAPIGAGVVIDAEHECMAIRGVRSSKANTILSALRGKFVKDLTTKTEFFKLIELRSRG